MVLPLIYNTMGWSDSLNERANATHEVLSFWGASDVLAVLLSKLRTSDPLAKG